MLETAIALIVVFALGYGVREWVSRRRHLEEKQQRRSLPEFLKSGGRPFVPNENFPQKASRGWSHSAQGAFQEPQLRSQHRRPLRPLNGAVAFVHDDEVEELRRDAGIVDNFGRLTLPWLGRIESRTFLVSRVE